MGGRTNSPPEWNAWANSIDMVNEAYGKLGARLLLWPDIMDTRADSDDDVLEHVDSNMPPLIDAHPDDPVMTHAIWLSRQ